MNRLRLQLGLLAGLLAATLPAMAEPRVAVDPPGSFVAGDPSLLVQSPGARGDGLLRALFLVDYVRAPLVLVSPRQESVAVVEEQLSLRSAFAFSLHHRWLFALDVPLLLRERGEPAPFATGLPPTSGRGSIGDPHLTARARVLGNADGFALGVGARSSIPLATETYAGSPGPVIGAFLSAGHRRPADFTALEVGFAWREDQTLPGILPTRIGSSLRFALAAGFALDGARSTRLGPELAVDMTVSNGARLLDPSSTVGQVLLHLQHRVLGGPFEVGAAFGPSLGSAPGAADYRALLSLVFSPEEPVPPPDGDGDRVSDDADMCPSLPGEASEDPMMHGCPALPSDADGDGIPDTLDACPRTVGEPSLVKARHGCPKPPPQAVDPVAPPEVKVDQAQLTISEQVQFETGTAQIRAVSEPLLRQVAAVLQRHPEIESCEVAGHTDDTGTAQLNLELSEARARAVVTWLVSQGVESARLNARGYGNTRPVADNTTDAGRARNRRVEFLITRRRAAGEAPP